MRIRIRTVVATVLAIVVAVEARARQMSEFVTTETGFRVEGWRGFTDIDFMINATATLTLAAVLGAIIAFHPRHRQTADTLAEIEAPKVFITYGVIGAIIGIMVVKYGLVVGFVLFGIGGLIRFRTVLGSASLTGHVILVTLIGLSCGLDLPHVAVLSTIFGFVLIYILDAQFTYRLNVRGLDAERVSDASVAYRKALEGCGYKVMSEGKNPVKRRITFIFRSRQTLTKADIDDILDAEVEKALRGDLDWEIN